MLNENLILRGPAENDTIPKGWSMGEYIFDCIKKRNPDEIFCIDGSTGKSLTCGEVLEQILKTVVVLRELGVESGDVVAIISENSINYCILLYASYYVGAAANLINPSYTTGELKRILNMSKPKIIFASESASKNICILKNEGFVVNQIVLLEEVSQEKSMDEFLLLDELLETAILSNKTITPSKIDSETQVALIFLTSGTTGLPKCAMITYENCRYSASLFTDPNYVGIQPGDTVLTVLPCFHIYGFAMTLLAAVYSVKLVLLPSFRPDIYLQCIQTYNVTLLGIVPTLVSFLAKHPLVKMYDLSSVKYITCAGCGLRTETQTEFSDRHPDVRIVQAYGLTEFSGFVAINPGTSSFISKSVGKIIPSAEVMVWSTSLSKNVGALETGELCFRGPSLMKGYMNVNNSNVDNYGFYHSGDLGYYDKHGYLYIVGRIKEIIKYKGFQVAPEEIENILMKHKAVVDCAVVGVPDERASQLATAFIVLQNQAQVTEQEIIDFVAERISVHKRLHGGVKIISSIPKNAAGKILRNELLKTYKIN